MASKRHTPEQIISNLRQAEAEIANGAPIPQVCKKIGVTDRGHFYREPLRGQSQLPPPRALPMSP